MAHVRLWRDRSEPWRSCLIRAHRWSLASKRWYWRLFVAAHIGKQVPKYVNSEGEYGRHCRRFVALIFFPVLVWQDNASRMLGLYLFGWALYAHWQK